MSHIYRRRLFERRFPEYFIGGCFVLFCAFTIWAVESGRGCVDVRGTEISERLRGSMLSLELQSDWPLVEGEIEGVYAVLAERTWKCPESQVRYVGQVTAEELSANLKGEVVYFSAEGNTASLLHAVARIDLDKCELSGAEFMAMAMVVVTEDENFMIKRDVSSQVRKYLRRRR